MRITFATFIACSLIPFGAQAQTPPPMVTATPPVAVKNKIINRTWQDALHVRMKDIDANYPGGTVGLYVKNLKTGKEFSYRGDEYWYVASGIKVPVALEVLRLIDAKALSLETKVEVLESDYIDGAGELNYIKPGSKVSVRLLLDQSLTFSDNTATDMLIRLVGLEKINALTASTAPQFFTPITTLAEVRRQAYATFHPDAIKLSNMDFIKLRVLKTEAAKIDRLAKLLKVKKSDLKHPSFDSAFEAYYSKYLNSATLRGYGMLLEKLTSGTILKNDTQKHMMDLLERVETGEKRIKAGLPKTFVFAHKTGTQHKRYCDMGIAKSGVAKSAEVLIVACVRNLPLEDAEKIFAKMGQNIKEAGAFAKGPK